MAEVKKAHKRERKQFIDVDPWQKQFAPVSERAVFEVFARKFNIPKHKLEKYSFQDCVDGLRKLDNPEYIAPVRASGIS